MRASGSIFSAPAGGTNLKAPAAGTDPVFQLLTRNVYCGAPFTVLLVMTILRGTGLSPTSTIRGRFDEAQASLDEARTLMHRNRLERVLVLGENDTLRGLITVKDMLKSTEHPLAAKDPHGRLRVGGPHLAGVGLASGSGGAGGSCAVPPSLNTSSRPVLPRL